MKRIKLKHVGNHWYPDIKHSLPEDISLDEKIERVLSLLKGEDDEFEICFYDGGSIIYDNTLQFSEESITKYFTTNDEFDIDFWIGDRKFKISSTLYDMLECQYEFNFHDTPYRIDLCPIF